MSISPERLEQLVIEEYNNQCGLEEKKRVDQLPSLEIRALIKVIAPMLKDYKDIKELINRGY